MKNVITLPYRVTVNGFDFRGFDVKEEKHGLFISEGRVGRINNPLIFTDEGVQGGWYFEGCSLLLLDDDVKVDIVLRKSMNDIGIIVRTEDETYNEEHYELLIPLARFEDNMWQVVRPTYKEEP